IPQREPLDRERREQRGEHGLSLDDGWCLVRRRALVPRELGTGEDAERSGAAPIRVAILRCSVARDAQRTGSTPRIPGSTGTSAGSRLATAPDRRSTEGRWRTGSHPGLARTGALTQWCGQGRRDAGGWRGCRRSHVVRQSPAKMALPRQPVAQQITFLDTRDLARTADFYERILGLRLARDQGRCRIYHVSGNAYVGFCETAEVAVASGLTLT